MASWMVTDQSPNPAKPGEMGGAWRGYPQESPITPSFSPYAPHVPPSAGWNAPVGADSATREDLPWPSYPPPPRSMSFGGESLSSQATGPYSPVQNRQYDRKSSTMSSDIYPSSLSTSVSGVDAATMEHSVSMPAGGLPSTSFGTWQQQYPYPRHGETFGGWGCGHNGSGAPDAEGEHNPPAVDGQAPGGMYYPPR